jgi:NDP-sugar pyrophosphorylase family protein
MKAAIIAAGLGERLRDGGYAQPKPLVQIGGRALIDYVLDAVAQAGLSEVACIVNQLSVGIEEHCRRQWSQLRFELIRRTTPSSMESLFTLAPLLANDRFVLLTVDALMPPALLAAFLSAARAHDDADGVLALTDLVDDEKPLWVQRDDAGRVTALGAPALSSGWITAGFYVFQPRIFDEIAAARAANFSALRQFLGHLVERGYRIYGEQVGKTLDVDRRADIAAAEEFVRKGFV